MHLTEYWGQFLLSGFFEIHLIRLKYSHSPSEAKKLVHPLYVDFFAHTGSALHAHGDHGQKDGLGIPLAMEEKLFQ